MGKIYVGQTALTIQLTTGVDIAGATCKIKYEKPDKSTGFWTAAIVDTTTGVIKYEIVSADDIDQAGTWIVWAYVTFSGGTVCAGEPVAIVVHSEGT